MIQVTILKLDFLGYLPPPSDNGEGGDNLYDIYVNDFTGLILYGQTKFDFSDGGTGPSFMEIENDFSSYPTKGINAARVTAAHEFHHAIQLGSYIYRASDLYFYEITSTSMEEFVYDSVNDYYNYLENYFNYSTINHLHIPVMKS